MANYPQLDDQVGVWKLKDVNDAVMGGYWRVHNSRGLCAGGNEGSVGGTNNIDFITLTTAGNATDFGDCTTVQERTGAISSNTRFLCDTSNSPGYNGVEYVQFMTTGNTADFGDHTAGRYFTGSASNSTRGLKFGGETGPSDSNVIDYCTMASTGNFVDFGNLTQARRSHNAGAGSPTRAAVMGGQTPSSVNTIDFVEIATTGNAVDFGDLDTAMGAAAQTSSSTRAVLCSGYDGSNRVGNVQFITIASQGNAIDYGDMDAITTNGAGGASNSVKAVISGGYTGSSYHNVIEQFQIPTGGTATDFGDLTVGRGNVGTGSNAHGGLNEGYQGTRIAPIPTGLGVGQRALAAGGFSGGQTTIERFNMTTTGNASQFGSLAVGSYEISAMSNTTRCLFAGGENPSGDTDRIEHVELLLS